MRFAISNNEKVEAEPGRTGDCIGCGRPMLAKCGEIKMWHWSHKGERKCDPWWENETEWHRSWKALYPKEWQEVPHISETGEKHIADVKTNLDWVVEIQHSYIDPQERKSRENFYKKVIWVVDGKRRKKDHIKFVEALNSGGVISNTPFFIRKLSNHDSALVREWAECDAPVFFDFGERAKSGNTEIEIVWWLLPRDHNGNRSYVVLETKPRLAQRLRDDASRAQDFEAVLSEFSSIIKEREEIEQKNRQILERRKFRVNPLGI
ncbi:MAG: competence protein CoiA [Bdellovibrionales bacterium]